MEKYLNLINSENQNVFDFLEKLTQNSFVESIGILRKEFPTLTLEEAKEILIIHDTEYESLDEYQKSIYNQLKSTNLDD